MLNNPVLKQQQKLIAWGMLVVLLLALIFLAIIPLVQQSLEVDQQIEDGYSQLAKFRQIAQSTPEFMAEYQRVQQQGLDKLFYPAGMTAAQVAKELQKQVASVIASGNGMLISSEVVDDPPTDDSTANTVYQRVIVKVVFQSNPALLREVLHQAYQSRPLIFVDALDIKPVDGENAKEQIMKAEVQISTYWRGGEVKRETTD